MNSQWIQRWECVSGRRYAAARSNVLSSCSKTTNFSNFRKIANNIKVRNIILVVLYVGRISWKFIKRREVVYRNRLPKREKRSEKKVRGMWLDQSANNSPPPLPTWISPERRAEKQKRRSLDTLMGFIRVFSNILLS